MPELNTGTIFVLLATGAMLCLAVAIVLMTRNDD